MGEPAAGEGAILGRLYGHRFAHQDVARQQLWRVLVANYFQRWVPPDCTVLDLAAGDCAFVNNVVASRRIAVDLNPAVRQSAADSVETYVCDATQVDALPSASVDRVFVSNFFEHLPRETILAVLEECGRLLTPQGRLLVLQPNIRYCARDYWMFFDHITPLDDRSLAEALALSGFEIEHQVTRFLPYTTKGALPSSPALVKAYLKVPVAWRVLGAQTFVVARVRPGAVKHV